MLFPGVPSPLWDSTNPDWIPTLHMGHNFVKSVKYDRCYSTNIIENIKLIYMCVYLCACMHCYFLLEIIVNISMKVLEQESCTFDQVTM